MNKPTDWRHELFDETGTRVMTKWTGYKCAYPFGKPGKDFSPEYTVKTTPLHPVAKTKKATP